MASFTPCLALNMKSHRDRQARLEENESQNLMGSLPFFPGTQARSVGTDVPDFVQRVKRSFQYQVLDPSLLKWNMPKVDFGHP